MLSEELFLDGWNQNLKNQRDMLARLGNRLDAIERTLQDIKKTVEEIREQRK